MNYKGIPVITLIMNVIIPIVGIIFLGWGALEVVYMYWFETIVIGLFNIPKMLLARGEKIAVFGKDYTEEIKAKQVQQGTSVAALKSFLVLFFPIHYGIFVAVQGAFIFGVISNGLGGESIVPQGYSFFGELFYPLYWVLSEKGLWLSVLLLVLSQFFEFLMGFVANGDYKIKNPIVLMIEPYKRIFIQQFTVIIGGGIIMITGAPSVVAILLILLKTMVDIWLQPSKPQGA